MQSKAMKRGGAAILLPLMTAAVLLTGCGEPKAAKEARLQGISQMKEEKYAEAIASFDTALDEAGGVVNEFELDILKYRAEAEYMLADFTASAHTYGILAEVDEGKPEYFYFKTASEAQAGNLETAKEDFNRAATADGGTYAADTPGAGLALTSLAAAARDAGDSQGAAEFCRQAIESGVSGPEIYNQMGMSLCDAGQYEEALQYFEEGLSLADTRTAAEIRRNMGALYEKKGDFAKALEVLKECAASGGMTPELEKEIAFLESR